MRSSEEAYDDLTVINGIKENRQDVLRESLGVHTYQDLAELSAEAIELRLKGHGPFSREDIERWLAEARELAAAKRAASPPREDGWEPTASFVVEFQTREAGEGPETRRTAVHHLERDLDEHWDGIACQELCRWMVSQVPGLVAVEPEEKGAPASETVATPTSEERAPKTKISQLRVFQPREAETPCETITPGHLLQGSIKADEPFRLEVDYELSGPAAASGDTWTECYAQSYAYDEVSHTSLFLGEAGPSTIGAGGLADTVALPDASLASGDYRLFVQVTPQAGAAVPDYMEVAHLQVM